MADDLNAASVPPKLFPSLQGQTGTTPALPKATPGTMSEESKNVFTELFGKDVAVKSGSMMSAVVQQQDKKNVSYFGDKPKEELSIKKFIKHKSSMGSSFLQFSVLAFFLTFGYFLTQNSANFSWFGINPALRVETFQSQVDSLNAEVRVQKHLAASLMLDQFVSDADEYLYDVGQAESAYTSQNKKDEFAQNAAALKPQLIELLGQIQVQLSENIPDTEIPAATLVADNLIASLRAKKGQVDDQSLIRDIQDLETAKAVLQNQSFKQLLAGLSVAELTDENIQSIFDTYNSINASSNSIISTIKAARPEWSSILDELEATVKSVDPLFGTEFTGNVTVSDIVFKSDGTITISGDTLTSDTTNFTLVSNLIDALEESSRFANVVDRSYQKSDDDSSYMGNFRITMNLENNPSSNE